MKKMLRAVVAAMLFATGAQAATVDGLFQAGPDGTYFTPSSYTAGQTYYFGVTLDPAELGTLPDGTTPADIVASELSFSISGQGLTGELRFALVPETGLTFRLRWMWQASGGTDFQFQDGYLKRFYNAIDTGTVVRNGTTGRLEGSFYGEKIGVATSVVRLAETNPTPVPIGGTLPLMLSALGLGALVMRRRAQRAAA